MNDSLLSMGRVRQLRLSAGIVSAVMVASAAAFLPLPCAAQAVIKRPAPVAVSETPIVVPEKIEVSGRTLTLAALLPANAPVELRSAAQNIDLGRGPLLGSIRVLKKDEMEARLKNFPEILQSILLPSQVIVQRRGSRIAPDQLQSAIAAFLRSRGWNMNGLPGGSAFQVEGAAKTSLPHAGLVVESATWDAEHKGLQFRVQCSDRTVCGNFLVHIQPGPETISLWRQRFGGPQQPFSVASAHALVVKRVAQKPSPELVLVLAGKPATLILQGNGIRITMPVICLEPGSLAQNIRVRDVLGKHSFEAKVIGAELLQAEL